MKEWDHGKINMRRRLCKKRAINMKTQVPLYNVNCRPYTYYQKCIKKEEDWEEQGDVEDKSERVNTREELRSKGKKGVRERIKRESERDREREKGWDRG